MKVLFVPIVLGLYLTSSDAFINNIYSMVYGAAWYDNALDILQSDCRIHNAVCRSAGDESGSWNHGVSMSGGAPDLENVTSIADATQGENTGMRVSGNATPIVRNCTLIGKGSSGDNYGLYQFGANIEVHQSVLEGATSALHVSNNGASTSAAHCQINGPTHTQYGGVLTLFGCYNESFVAVP